MSKWVNRRSSVTSSLANAFTSNKERHDNALLEGSLWKKKTPGKGWGRYWFELSANGSLKCFGKLKIKSPLESFNVFDLISIKSVKLKGNPLPHQPNCIFFMIKNTSTHWILAANNENEYIYWSNNIKKILLADSRYTGDFSDSESEDDDDYDIDNNNHNDSNNIKGLNDIIQTNYFPLTCNSMSMVSPIFENYISDKLFDELYSEYYILLSKIPFYEGEIYRLSDSLDVANSIIQQKSQAESNLKEQFEKLQNTLDNTNDRLHRAMSELLKHRNTITKSNPKEKDDYSVDFKYLLQTRNSDFLLWLGIFPPDLPPPPIDILSNEKKNKIEEDNFKHFISDSSSIQVRLLKKYLSQLVIGHFDTLKINQYCIKEKCKYEKYITKQKNILKHKEKHYKLSLQDKQTKLSNALNIIKKQQNICNNLYDYIKKIEEENRILKQKQNYQGNINKLLTKHSNNDNNNKTKHLLLSTKIIQLQEQLEQKDIIINELKEVCIQETASIRKIFTYSLYFIILLVIFLLFR